MILLVQCLWIPLIALRLCLRARGCVRSEFLRPGSLPPPTAAEPSLPPAAAKSPLPPSSSLNLQNLKFVTKGVYFQF